MTLPLLIAVGFAVGFYAITLSAIARTGRLTDASPVIIFATGTLEEKTSVVLLFVFPLAFVASALLPGVPIARVFFDVPAVRAAGAVALAGGLCLHFVALRTLGEAFQIGVDPLRTPGIVREGPYRLIRHPVYTAFLLYFLGAWLVIPNALFSIVTPFAALRIYAQARYEEDALVRRFGPEYQAYMRSTARFIPGVL